VRKTVKGRSISILNKYRTELKTEVKAIDKKKFVKPRAIDPLTTKMNARNMPNRMADGSDSRIAYDKENATAIFDTKPKAEPSC
jgi:hypothetical protein